MHVSTTTLTPMIVERHFILDLPGGAVPGVLVAPRAEPGTAPLVLLAHGNGQHSMHPGVLARARRFAAAHRLAVAALDAPGHGGRYRTREDTEHTAELRRLRAGTGSVPVDHVARYDERIAEQAVPEWLTALAALRGQGLVRPSGPVGFWGVSLGAVVGVHLLAAEPRISAAVIGLAGGGRLVRRAPRVSAAVEFLVQDDDELVPAARSRELFHALGSRTKVLRSAPGGHHRLPREELDRSGEFLARFLRVGPGEAALPGTPQRSMLDMSG